jgi:hypothetical protein
MAVSYWFVFYLLFVLCLCVIREKNISDWDSSSDINGRALDPSLVRNGALRQHHLRESTKQREMVRIQAERANRRPPRRSVLDKSKVNAINGDVMISSG